MKFTKVLKNSKIKGFTLIELMLVVAVLAMLAAITIIAINPTLMFAKARDAIRYRDLEALNKAIQEYSIDYRHAPYLQGNCSPSTPDPSCYANETAGSPYSWALLEEDIGNYILYMPEDPCGENCFVVTESGPKFYTYSYYAPAQFLYNCLYQDQCGKYTTLTAEEVKPMYSIYAQRLEAVEMSAGMALNQFMSY